MNKQYTSELKKKKEVKKSGAANEKKYEKTD